MFTTLSALTVVYAGESRFKKLHMTIISHSSSWPHGPHLLSVHNKVRPWGPTVDICYYNIYFFA